MSKLPTIFPDQEGMTLIANMLRELLPEEYGFALITFQYGDGCRYGSYVSSAIREDMIKGLKECVERLESNKDFKTPSAR